MSLHFKFFAANDLFHRPMRARGPRLGEILEEQGRLSREQLLRALRNQKVVGGKLGTCLLEIDAVPEEALLRALATQQGVETASAEDLRGIPDEVISLVPAKVARVHFAVPFRATGTQVQVAMIDARDLRALDELAFVTGRRVRPHVACEMRLLEALEKNYGEECPPRFVKLLDRLNRSRFLWRSEDETATREEPQWGAISGKPAPAASPQRLPPLPPPPPNLRDAPAARPAPLPRATATVPVAVPATRAAEAKPQLVPLEEVERRLLQPSDVDDVGRALVDFAAGRTRAAALFQLRKSEIAGWMGYALDPVRLGALRLDLDRPSLFVALREGAAMHRGPLPELAGHSALRTLLGESAGLDLVVFPLRVRERLVAALLIAPTHANFSAESLDELQRVVAKASIALELCIMRKKLQRA